MTERKGQAGWEEAEGQLKANRALPDIAAIHKGWLQEQPRAQDWLLPTGIRQGAWVEAGKTLRDSPQCDSHHDNTKCLMASDCKFRLVPQAVTTDALTEYSANSEESRARRFAN
jgi:hypothetical protein